MSPNQQCTKGISQPSLQTITAGEQDCHITHTVAIVLFWCGVECVCK